MRRDNTQRPRPASEGGLRKKSKNSSSGAKVHLEQTFMSELKLRPTMPGTFSANCRKAGPTKAKAAARRTTGKGTGLPLLLRPSRRWTVQRQKRNGKTADLKFGHYTIRKDGNRRGDRADMGGQHAASLQGQRARSLEEREGIHIDEDGGLGNLVGVAEGQGAGEGFGQERFFRGLEEELVAMLFLEFGEGCAGGA